MAHCTSCGGWDRAQLGRGHKMGCTIGTPGTPIAHGQDEYPEWSQEGQVVAERRHAKAEAKRQQYVAAQMELREETRPVKPVKHPATTEVERILAAMEHGSKKMMQAAFGIPEKDLNPKKIIYSDTYDINKEYIDKKHYKINERLDNLS